MCPVGPSHTIKDHVKATALTALDTVTLTVLNVLLLWAETLRDQPDSTNREEEQTQATLQTQTANRKGYTQATVQL